MEITFNVDKRDKNHTREDVIYKKEWKTNPFPDTPETSGEWAAWEKNELKRHYIKAKLFVSMNMERVEDMMALGKMKEGEYITTLDTLMIQHHIILPRTKQMIKCFDFVGKQVRDETVEFFERYKAAFEHLWLNRAKTKRFSGSNVLDIYQISSTYDFASHYWKTNPTTPIIYNFRANDISVLKSIMPRWKRDFIDEADRLLAETDVEIARQRLLSAPQARREMSVY